MKPTLYLDIETVRRPGAAPDTFSPPQLKCVCLGCMLETEGKFKLATFNSAIPTSFSRLLSSYKPKLVTFNGRKFDIPVLASECFFAGVQIPFYYNDRNMRYRYSAESHLDLCDQLSDNGAGRPGSLHWFASGIGWPGKGDVCGEDVEKMFVAGETQKIADYCSCDVVQTAALAVRWEYMVGALPKTAHNEKMTTLIGMTEDDARLVSMKGKIDKAKALIL